MVKFSQYFSLSLLLFIFGSTEANFHISNVFGNHMVLQRNTPNPLWGWTTNPSTMVTVLYLGNTYNTTSSSTDGFWKVTLPSTPGSFTPLTIVASVPSTGESQTLVDVLIGDVYLCSGQSNMEFTVNAVVNATTEVQNANNYPNIRITSGPEQGLFNLNNASFNQPFNELAVTDLPWSVATNVTVGCLVNGCSGWNYFSAACWFTLKSSYDMLEANNDAVPLGGIAQTYGGTSIQWWSSSDAINSCNTPPGSACCNYGGQNSCLYNTQIAPYVLGPTSLSGFLWYQGEQNAGCGGVPQISYYNCGLQSLINDVRVKFQSPNLPFGIFLLAAWQDSDPWFPLLRLIQVNASLTMTNVFTSSTLDRGEPAGGPVHSPYKQEPGRRAALALQDLVYKQNVPYIGPRYTGAKITSMSSSQMQITVSFTSESLYGQSLMLNTSVTCPSTVTSASCESFAVQTSDCMWQLNGNGNVTTALTSDGTGVVFTLTIPSNAPNGFTAVATRGLFGNWPVVQLYNGVGLPSEPWLASINNVINNCPSPWNSTTYEEELLNWVDDGRHA